MDGNFDDFDPIFRKLIELCPNSTRILHDPDAYAAPFIPVAEDLFGKASKAEQQGNAILACEMYLRSAAVYRISRFPIIRTEIGKIIWTRQKEAYAKASAYLNPPSYEVSIPFKHVDITQGDLDTPIEAYIRLPLTTATSSVGHPVVLFICGLDAYRTDHNPRTQAYVDAGFATISFEIPGTGDYPGAPTDPSSPDRILSSVLDWIQSNSGQYNLDTSKVCVRSISTGGYYGMRAAHTHGDRLLAVVAQGGGCHHMFDENWINMQNQMEYPFALAEALAFKFGYPDVTSYAQNSNARMKFSLLEGRGAVIEKSNCKLLVINGMEDSIFPIEDSILIVVKGANKDLVCRAQKRHMGNPGAEEIINQWLKDQVADS